MEYPASFYVEERQGGLYIKGTRVTLDSVAFAFQRGESPAQIVRGFPTIKLSQAYGAIAYYLDNQSEIDAYLDGRMRQVESFPPLSVTNPALFARLEAARLEAQSLRS